MQTLLAEPDVLLLDEPTNHLDIESREVLEEALENFDGTVVLISHDRALLSVVATRVWHLDEGRITDFAGGLDEWRERESQAAKRTEPAQTRPAAGPAPKQPSPSGGLSKNELQRRQRLLEQVEGRIHDVEARIAEIEERLADPRLYAAGADPKQALAPAERDPAQAELAALYGEWERVGEELAGV